MENGRRGGFQDMLVGFSKVYQSKLKHHFCTNMLSFLKDLIECQNMYL